VPKKIKKQPNIFLTPRSLKSWAIDLVEACGSEITNKKHNTSKIDALIEKFVSDYNDNMTLMVELANSIKQEEE
jgi:hypothetical protein|tara:strand:- start:1395 stop:1616 length:222 start_codon:yes stop_codon:yes gene_type:complete